MKRKTDRAFSRPRYGPNTGQSDLYKNIYLVVTSIPHGRVATYGQIARLAGIGGKARLVGYALHNLPDNSNVPWHRVINRHGKISLSNTAYGTGILQQKLLEQEGICFDREGSVDLERFQWCE